MEKHLHLSKSLSLVLRHKPEVIGVMLDEQGWCEVDDLIAAMQSKGKIIDRNILEEIVETDSKQRYAFDVSAKRIRARQGHSIEVDLCLQSTKPPEVLYHGTSVKFLSSILENGIVKGQRQYVHLSQDYQTATTVGSRRGQAIVLTVDSKKMYDCGYEFFLSENGVWLCDYVSTEFISYE